MDRLQQFFLPVEQHKATLFPEIKYTAGRPPMKSYNYPSQEELPHPSQVKLPAIVDNKEFSASAL